MSNEVSSGKTKKSPIAKLPPGVTVDKMLGSGGNEYWRVRLGKKFTGTRTITKYFKTLSTAREWITGDAKDERTSSPSPLLVKAVAGPIGFELTPNQLGSAIAAQKLLNEASLSIDLYAVTQFYLRHTRPEGGEKTIPEVIEELLAVKRRAGKKDSYLKNLGWPLRKFAADFEDSKIHEITKDDFEGWLDEEDFSLATRRNYIRDCGVLFNFAILKKWMTTSPTEGIEKPMVEDREIKILSIRQIARLLLTAQRTPSLHHYLAPIAIQLFAGVRTSEIKRLDWGDVRDKQIIITASNAKTRQRRTITISDALTSWIADQRKDSGPIFPKGKCWRTGFTQLVEAARITPWPRNALRHCFGSYHFAYHKNENLTAAEMGNTPQVIFKHYRAVVLDRDEIKFWKLINKKQEKNVIPFKVA